MDVVTMFVIALGLAMDSLAVSISSGICMSPFLWRKAFQMALVMGGFQGGMTLLGWLLGCSFSTYITAYDHWIAFALLAFLGGKMIYESMQDKPGSFVSFSMKTILTLGVATSIDALAVGVSMAFLQVNIFLPASIIAFVAFSLSFAGVHVGYRFGKIRGLNIELLGGIVLVAIGIKILVEHLCFD